VGEEAERGREGREGYSGRMKEGRAVKSANQ